MISFFSYRLRAFTLVDVMMGVVMTSMLLVLMTGFVKDTLIHHRSISQFQQLRSDVFRLSSQVFPKLIRESSGIDYAQTTDMVLSLFTDAYEQESLQIIYQKTDEGLGELVYQQGDTVTRLHSSLIDIEDMSWIYPEFPRSSSQKDLQPVVAFRIQARFASELPLERPVRLAYEGLSTLRNVSFSSYRHLL